MRDGAFVFLFVCAAHCCAVSSLVMVPVSLCHSGGHWPVRQPRLAGRRPLRLSISASPVAAQPPSVSHSDHCCCCCSFAAV